MSQRRKRKFHFEALWTRKANCMEVIEEAWNGCLDLQTLGGLTNGLKHCAAALTKWNNVVFGKIPKKIQEKKKALNVLIIQDKEREKDRKSISWGRKLMNCRITRKCGGCKGLESNGWEKKIAIQKFSTTELLRGERKIQLLGCGMKMEAGVMTRIVLLLLSFLT